MDFPRFFIVDFPLKFLENIVIVDFPFSFYSGFSFIVDFHGTPEGVQWKLQHLCQGGAIKLCHHQALAMEFALWLGYEIKC